MKVVLFKQEEIQECWYCLLGIDAQKGALLLHREGIKDSFIHAIHEKCVLELVNHPRSHVCGSCGLDGPQFTKLKFKRAGEDRLFVLEQSSRIGRSPLSRSLITSLIWSLREMPRLLFTGSIKIIFYFVKIALCILGLIMFFLLSISIFNFLLPPELGVLCACIVSIKIVLFFSRVLGNILNRPRVLTFSNWVFEYLRMARPFNYIQTVVDRWEKLLKPDWHFVRESPASLAAPRNTIQLPV